MTDLIDLADTDLLGSCGSLPPVLLPIDHPLQTAYVFACIDCERVRVLKGALLIWPRFVTRAEPESMQIPRSILQLLQRPRRHLCANDAAHYRHGCDPPDSVDSLRAFTHFFCLALATASFGTSRASRSYPVDLPADHSRPRLREGAMAQRLASQKAVLIGCVLLTSVFGCGPEASVESDMPADPAHIVTAETPRADTSFPVPFSARSSNVSAFSSAPEKPFVVPEWVATHLASSDVHVRLQALDSWVESAPVGALDPLIKALEDEDERVQQRAIELLVQDWQRDQEAN